MEESAPGAAPDPPGRDAPRAESHCYMCLAREPISLQSASEVHCCLKAAPFGEKLQSFKVLLRYEKSAQARLAQENRRVELQDVIAISERKRTVEDIIAGWYSFQRLESIHVAFNEWFKIDIWKLLRTQTSRGKWVTTFDERLNGSLAKHI